MKVYHYTNLKSFEAILKNKTIRFSSLSSVNDKYEGETQELGNVGKYIFVSCWTTCHKEDSKMWDIYGDKFSGIRICLEMPIFKLYQNNDYQSIIPICGIFEDTFYILPSIRGGYFFRINYSDDKSHLQPNIIEVLDNFSKFKFGILGKYKSKSWEYENESRFIIHTVPTSEKKKFENQPYNAIYDSIELMKKNFDISKNYIDLEISENSFGKMEIVRGVKMNKDDTENLYYIVSKFNPSAKIFDSSFLISN